MKPQLPNKLRKRQLTALLAFALLICIVQAAVYFYKKSGSEAPPVVVFEAKDNKQTQVFAEFDPNTLDATQWQKLGFSERQAETILKYKAMLGGNFSSKAEIQKCYVISPEKFSEIEPYILLPENSAGKASENHFSSYEKKTLNIPGKFNPDQLSAAQWQKMGFSEKQANAILKYKAYLGGSFRSKEKFKACFIISDENYEKLAPYLLLPERAPEPERNFAKPEKPQASYAPFDPNLLGADGWQKLGFSERQAAVIINYRDRNLHGSFKNLEDIQRCFVISTEKFAELKPYIRLNPETMKTTEPAQPQYYASKTENAQPEAKTDFAKTDLNQISFKQLREFGFTEKDAAMLLSFRKKLGGFVDKNQVVETYEIDKDLAQKLVLSCPLNSAGVQKYTLTEAPEDWLKTHPYFKYSADKIIFYRISYPDDRKIWKYLRLKPEYEQKMRLYVRN